MFLFIRPSFVANPQAAGRLIPPSPIFGRDEALGGCSGVNPPCECAAPTLSATSPWPRGLDWESTGLRHPERGSKSRKETKMRRRIKSLCGAGLHTGGAFSGRADSFPAVCTAGGGHTHTHLERAARSPQPAQALRAPPHGCPPGKLSARPRLLDRRRSCEGLPGRPRGTRREKRGPGKRRTRSRGRAPVPNPRSRPRAVTTPPAPGTGCSTEAVLEGLSQSVACSAAKTPWRRRL